MRLLTGPLAERDRSGEPPAIGSPDDLRVLALHPQGTRRPERSLVVALVAGTGAPFVLRIAAPASRAHALDLWRHYGEIDERPEPIRTPGRRLVETGDGRLVVVEAFEAGPSIGAELARALDREDMDGALAQLARYRMLLEQVSRPDPGGMGDAFARRVAGGWTATPGDRWLPGGALDLVPQNVMLGPAGPCAIDLEWSLGIDVPADFVAARAALLLAERSLPLVASWHDAGIDVVDLGGGLHLPEALLTALLPGRDAAARALPAVWSTEPTLQAAAGWRRPWEIVERPDAAPAPAAARAPSPLELYGWRRIRDRVEREHAELRHLRWENARMRRELSFTLIGLLRRAARRLPWVAGPARSIYRRLMGTGTG